MEKNTVQNEVKVVTNIVNEAQLRKAQLRALKIFEEAVRCTYGPMGGYTAYSMGEGKNIMSNYTKDGFTVLKHVEVDKPIESMLKDQIRDICTQIIKVIGDGTTSATMLSYYIFDGLVKLQNAIPKRIMIETFKDLLDEGIHEIEKNKREATLDDIYNIALTSLNGDKENADIIRQIYESKGMNVFIDVGISNSTDTITRNYSGMVYDNGYISPAFINTDNNTCEFDNPAIFVFESPIDTPQMINNLAMIIKKMVEDPIIAYRKAQETGKTFKKEDLPRNTLIICPFISRDANGYLDQLINSMTQLPANARPPICIVSGVRNDNDFLNDIMALTGARFIKKYLDPNSYKSDKVKGLVLTPNNIPSFAGNADKVVVDAISMRIINPKNMYDKEGNYSEYFNNYVSQLKDTLVKYEETREELVKIGHLKRRINIITNSMVDLLIGGIGISDRDALKDSVEDAVLNCRSAAANGVGYGANYEGFRVYNEISRIVENNLNEVEEKLKDENISDEDRINLNKQKYSYLIKSSVAKIILTAYTRLVVTLYLPYCDGDVNSATKIAIYSISAKNEEERTPFNIINHAFDGKVLTSIKTETSMLYAIKKIITLLFNTNQFILPDPRFNIYEMTEESETITVDTTVKDESEKAENTTKDETEKVEENKEEAAEGLAPEQDNGNTNGAESNNE